MMLATRAETVGTTGRQVYARVWVSNRYHLLVETDDLHHPLQCPARSARGRCPVFGFRFPVLVSRCAALSTEH